MLSARLPGNEATRFRLRVGSRRTVQAMTCRKVESVRAASPRLIPGRVIRSLLLVGFCANAAPAAARMSKAGEAKANVLLK
jgi:hypothetical protein